MTITAHTRTGKPLLMRGPEVRELLGVGKHALAGLVEAGLLREIRTSPTAVRLYRLADVEALLERDGGSAGP